VHVLDAFWDHQSRDRLEDPCHQGQVHQPNQFYQGQDPLGDRGCHQNLRGGEYSTAKEEFRRKMAVFLMIRSPAAEKIAYERTEVEGYRKISLQNSDKRKQISVKLLRLPVLERVRIPLHVKLRKVIFDIDDDVDSHVGVPNRQVSIFKANELVLKAFENAFLRN
jgi:hypothetical protein